MSANPSDLPTTHPQHDLLRDLIDQLIEDQLSDADRVRLNELLRDDEAAVAYYVEYMSLSADLHRISEEQAPPEALEIAFESELSKRYHNKRRFDWGAAVAAAIVIGFIGLVVYTVFPETRKHMPYLERFAQRPLTVNYATVTQSDGALLNRQPVSKGLRLGEQMLQLDAGQVTMRFEAGTVATVHAPARFRLTGYNNLQLLSGKLIAEVPQEAVGYTVETPDATVVDLGTRFGVHVEKNTATEVHVFKGKVHARISDRLTKSTEGSKPRVELVQGEAARLEAAGYRILPLAEARPALFEANQQIASLVAAPQSTPRAAPQVAPTPASPYTYLEEFEGNPGTPLAGSKPTEGPTGTRWIADPLSPQSGQFEPQRISYAALPFAPAPGHLYTVSIEVYPNDTPGERKGLSAFTLGFVTGNVHPNAADLTRSDLTWHQFNQPLAWMQLSGDSLSVSNGNAVENFSTQPQDPSGKRTLKMVLDTRNPAWKIGWYIGTGFVGEKVFFRNPTEIDYVSFGTSQFSGAADNFKLLVE